MSKLHTAKTKIHHPWTPKGLRLTPAKFILQGEIEDSLFPLELHPICYSSYFLEFTACSRGATCLSNWKYDSSFCFRVACSLFILCNDLRHPSRFLSLQCALNTEHSFFILTAPMLDPLPLSWCTKESNRWKSWGYFPIVCSMFVNNLGESFRNKATTSSTKLGLDSSCSSSSWLNCSSR